MKLEARVVGKKTLKRSEQVESQVLLAATSKCNSKLSSRFLIPEERIRSGDLWVFAAV
jgi:hypothetical protein